ncbi:NUDIX domain-containing protein [Marinifilum sp. N1E240]|uniref:NUDIX hydrolase n=1 Tax=Marinifilum sp. N1E240 TaxID=2608082 RepID=UPI00128C34AD|nr:NUDIX domain-containing protein [Marinifilum sp. N1E240]MPQ46499.1 NUDIX domain-containing protein [Marinifilum sp. N1E240]
MNPVNKGTLPENVIAFCPKCGSANFKYREDNSFLCENCNFHLYINSAAAVAALIVNDDGEILLTKRAIEPQKGMLDLPGGFVDVMETAENAVSREIKEELNLDVKSMKYFMSFPNEYIFGGISVFTIDLAFACSVINYNKIHAKDDISAFKFYKFSEIDFDNVCSGSIPIIIREFIKMQRD